MTTFPTKLTAEVDSEYWKNRFIASVHENDKLRKQLIRLELRHQEDPVKIAADVDSEWRREHEKLMKEFTKLTQILGAIKELIK